MRIGGYLALQMTGDGVCLQVLPGEVFKRSWRINMVEGVGGECMKVRTHLIHEQVGEGGG